MPSLSHILVAYKGGPSDDELLRAGCRLAREARALVSVLHVIEVPMSFGLDAHNIPGQHDAEVVAERCDRVASELGVTVNAETINARDADTVIIEHARNSGVDLILVGAGRVRADGRAGLTRTAQFVLANAPCSVFIGRFLNGK